MFETLSAEECQILWDAAYHMAEQTGQTQIFVYSHNDFMISVAVAGPFDDREED